MAYRSLLISYQLAGKSIHDRATMEGKLRREGMQDDDIFQIVWGRERKEFTLAPRVRGVVLKARFPSIKPLYDLLSVWAVPSAVKRSGFRPERVVIPDFSLCWAAARVRRQTGANVQLRLNGLPSQLAATRGLVRSLYYRLQERLAKRFIDEFIAINGATRDYLLKLGIEKRRISVRAPDTISADLSLIASARPGAMRERLGIAPHEKIVLSVGRLEPEKAFDELIRVFAESKLEARLVIAGEGRLRHELEQEIRELGVQDRVILAGQQNRAQLWECYKDADAFVLLSKSEALGLSVWEAMYAGVPVIGRPIGGIKESIHADGERGFFWDSKDGPAAFADKLKRCFGAGSEVVTMCERAQKYVRATLRL